MVIAMRAVSAGGMVSTATVAIELDAAGDRGQPRHQGEGFEIVVPEVRLAAEAAQLDHRQGEVEAILLGAQHDFRLRSKLGVYCGEVVEISQPLFPMGMKTPISMAPSHAAMARR